MSPTLRSWALLLFVVLVAVGVFLIHPENKRPLTGPPPASQASTAVPGMATPALTTPALTTPVPATSTPPVDTPPAAHPTPGDAYVPPVNPNPAPPPAVAPATGGPAHVGFIANGKL